ncbi:hypothetical protein I3842_11G063000 [Carya illinoinensis]|uniref:Neprosin PEP catalytic domain-containing protein n=1 Tax=Carya illinoinensis TaxID=32201 RepID=A0A922DNF5_CARIL|nr:hypothetical protein I3842_11G063000 [Carya illinoinensis]
MASMVDVLLVLFVWFLLLNHNEVDANWGLSRKEELRFKEQLTSLSTSAIRSIHEDGDVYDCIDFYKQPGFNHPFRKNTTFQILKRKLFMEGLQSKTDLPLKIGLKDDGCPYGTVPIRRIDKDEVNSDLKEEPGHHLNGRTQCFNQQCPGYIQLSSEIPLGWPIGRISVVGGIQYALKLRISKNYMNTGPNSRESVWLLQLDEDMLMVGLWPTKVFGRLNDLGNQADWGGRSL